MKETTSGQKHHRQAHSSIGFKVLSSFRTRCKFVVVLEGDQGQDLRPKESAKDPMRRAPELSAYLCQHLKHAERDRCRFMLSQPVTWKGRLRKHNISSRKVTRIDTPPGRGPLAFRAAYQEGHQRSDNSHTRNTQADEYEGITTRTPGVPHTERTPPLS
jgi:hypothetical protein